MYWAGKSGGSAWSQRNPATRRIFALSSVVGVAPVPKPALRFRSSTRVLFPSQWSCIPSFHFWFQTAGKSALPTFSRSGAFSMGNPSSALGGSKVSTRPGPQLSKRTNESRDVSVRSCSRTRVMPR